MKPSFILPILVFYFLIYGCRVQQEIPPEMSVYGPKSDFIFKGQVRVLHTSTIDAADAEDLGVVRVNEIIKSPPNLENFRGKDITIRFTDINRMSVGKDMIFFTNVNYLGNDLVAAEVGNMPINDAKYSIESLRANAAEVMKTSNDQRLQELVRKSEVIAVGKIARVSQPQKQNFDSEHDPMWTEAVIEVEETMKGSNDRTISFVFSASMDVAWYQSPRFKEGDQGLFLLSREPAKTNIRDRFVLIHNEQFITDREIITKVRTYAK